MSGLVDEFGKSILNTPSYVLGHEAINRYYRKLFDSVSAPSIFSSLGQSPILDETGKPFKHKIKGSDRVTIRTRIKEE